MSRRPTFKTIDVLELVERLEPNRHEPRTEYQFTNGRKFVRETEYTVTTHETFRVEDGRITGFETFRVSDGAGGFEDYLVVR